jgi:hypothetical protein
MAAFLEQVLRVGLLEVAAADLAGREMRGNTEHRHARPVTIEQPVDEMQVAGPAAAGANRELPGQMRLGAGGEGAGLFVAHMHPLDLTLPADGIGEAIEAVADDAADALDARRGEGFDELVSDRFWHIGSLQDVVS